MAVKLSHVSAAALMAVALAACGGGSDSSTTADTSDAADAATTAVEETTAAATDAAEDTVAAVEDAAADAGDAASDVVADATDAAADAADNAASDLADAAQGAADAAQDAVTGAVTDAVNAAADQVPDEVIAQYASLTGDAAKGRRVFTQCMSCHVVAEGQNRVGPSLYGVVGRDAGSVESFKYSDANANSGIVWTEATLFKYLENPRQFIPGTIMAFPGLRNPQDRADVIAYIKSESN